MKKDLCLLFLFFSILPLAAQNAIFYADTSVLRKYAGSADNFDRVLQMRWIINGKTLTWGGNAVKIKPDRKKLDTILFKNNDKSAWDTIICNISLPHTYNFVYNTCCGGFNIENSTMNSMPKGRVIFVQDSKTVLTYLGKLGETAVLLDQIISDTISPMCRSAMSPNVYWVSVEEIENCYDGKDCEQNELFCLFRKDEEPEYDFSYKVKNTITRFLYMPLDNSPLRVEYDIHRNVVLIE